MLSLDHWVQEKTPPVRMIMQVHDELVFEIREEALDSACAHIRQAMESAASLEVPLLVDVGVGDNWDEAH
jgi:DNA polymerase-1